MFSFEGVSLTEWKSTEKTFAFLLSYFSGKEKQVRVNGDEGTPVPIPNTVVKLINGEKRTSHTNEGRIS